jgi:hypothetical protein
MLTISVKRIVDAITIAPTFTPPELNVGAQYIQEKIADRLARGNEVRLSEINFEAFDLEDIDGFQSFHEHMGQHEHRCDQVAQAFFKLKPATVSGTFI